jgi:hypothetical protein
MRRGPPWAGPAAQPGPCGCSLPLTCPPPPAPTQLTQKGCEGCQGPHPANTATPVEQLNQTLWSCDLAKPLKPSLWALSNMLPGTLVVPGDLGCSARAFCPLPGFCPTSLPGLDTYLHSLSLRRQMTCQALTAPGDVSTVAPTRVSCSILGFPHKPPGQRLGSAACPMGYPFQRHPPHCSGHSGLQ